MRRATSHHIFAMLRSRALHLMPLTSYFRNATGSNCRLLWGSMLELAQPEIITLLQKKLQKSWSKNEGALNGPIERSIRFVCFSAIYIPIYLLKLSNWCSVALIYFVFLVTFGVCQFYESLSAMIYKEICRQQQI